MKQAVRIHNATTRVTLAVLVALSALTNAFARDVEYTTGRGEVEVFVNVGEPTEIIFEGGKIKDGFKNSNAGISLDKKDSSLVVFGNQSLNENGEAILVRLDNGRSYPLRIRRANSDNPRDAQVTVSDGKSVVGADEEEVAPFKERSYDYAPPSKVSGLMREMVLVAEFGKSAIPGYTISERHKGQTVVSDGAILAKIDKILVGPNLWGYVLDTTNLLDQTQKLNAATFRLDGTRAISASTWELAPRPMNVEDQLSGKNSAKVYIVTRAR
ncbi:MAG: hypothetical protein RL518_322 [Pseudomonadota bacterium]